MNPASEPSRWSSNRWWLTIGVLFLVQAFLVILLAQRTTPIAPRPKGTAVRLLANPVSTEDAFKDWLALDPTVLVLANSRGFSGGGWLETPVQNHQLPDWDEPERWLDLDTESLGGALVEFTKSNSASSLQIVQEIPPPFKPLQYTADPSLFASRFYLEAPLHQRLLTTNISLPPMPAIDILSNSIVQIGVDGKGEVTSLRLMGHCGSVVADQKAMGIARALQFRAIDSGPDASKLVWGRAVFQWQTIPLATNEGEGDV